MALTLIARRAGYCSIPYSSGVERRRTSFVAVAVAVLVSACSTDGREMSPPSPDQTQSIALPSVAPSLDSFDITTTGVIDGRLDLRHTCFGAATSPPIEFLGVASDIVSLGIVMADEQGTTNWAMANIDPTAVQVAEGTVPAGAIQAMNPEGGIGYAAPCPPAGESSTYRLMGYALPQQVELPDGVDATTLIELLESAALDVAVIDIVVSGS